MLPSKYKNSKIVLYGAGNFSKILINYFDLKDYNILGFVDKNPSLKGQKFGNYRIFGLEDLESLNPDLIILTVMRQQQTLEDNMKAKITQNLTEIKNEKQLKYEILSTFNEYEQLKKFYQTFSESYFENLTRANIAHLYINKGSGIEIGARHTPMILKKEVKVSYVDKYSNDYHLSGTPEIGAECYAKVDINDDAQTLSKISADSQDFVIANHVLEHLQNPILSIKNMLNILKKGGILFLTIPDKRETFDIDREITPLDHIIKDFEKGPESSLKEHLKELVKNLNDEEKIEEFINSEQNKDLNIHFHVWTITEITELFLYLKKLFDFEIELICKQPGEVMVVAKK